MHAKPNEILLGFFLRLPPTESAIKTMKRCCCCCLRPPLWIDGPSWRLTALLSVFFFLSRPQTAAPPPPPPPLRSRPAAKSHPAGIIGPPVHLFLPFTLPESSPSDTQGRRTRQISVTCRSVLGPSSSQTYSTFIFFL